MMTAHWHEATIVRPDRPLVVKCTHHQSHKSIIFSSCRSCSYETLLRKVEQGFALYTSSYAIAYEDDDGELTPIATDDDLTEAIAYFHSGSDSASTSSFSSAFSCAREVTLVVRVAVAYDGPSLSDSASLASAGEWDRASVASCSSGRLSRASSGVFERLRREAASPCGFTRQWLQDGQAGSDTHEPPALWERKPRAFTPVEKLATVFESDFERLALSDAGSAGDRGSSDGSQGGDVWAERDDGHSHSGCSFGTSRKACGCTRPKCFNPRSLPDPTADENHHLDCEGCGECIFGVRYQCGSCSSLPSAYNLCEDCERRSYLVHDPMHIFIKIPRPVDRQLQIPRSLFSTPAETDLYLLPVGACLELDPEAQMEDYLCSVLHPGTTCHRCTTRIRGKWFHCAYCSRDLCTTCEANDDHDPTHVFVVLKSQVNTKRFFTYPVLDHGTARYTKPMGHGAIIPYPLYHS